MSPNRLKLIPSSLAGIFQGIRLYPGKHPLVRKQLDNTLSAMNPFLLQQGRLTIGLVDGTLMVDDLPCMDEQSATDDLKQLLEGKEIKAVEFLPGLDADQLVHFCLLISSKESFDLQDRMDAAGVTAIQVTLEEDGARAIYNQALEVVESVYQDVRMGQIPTSESALAASREMVEVSLAEPYALFSMSLLKDYDNYTFTHSVNVSVLAVTVGRACGVSEEDLNILSLGGMLHDVGKMTIDHSIITKPGKLSEDEFEQMRQHPTNGAEIVAKMAHISPIVQDIVNGHHLRFDRTGYPADSRGKTLSPLVDIVTIADIYDAMTTIRCYQKPLSPRQALEKIRALSGNFVHPEFIEKFIAFLGPYPVGSLVRTDEGSIGLVVDQNQSGKGTLTIKQIFNPAGDKLDPPAKVELPDVNSIVAEVDPLLKGINVQEFLD
ncbi:MAG TPA: HD-GYP domain-containing protein [Geopsychrobacteraceae bacterium]|nr:HD-GYP domain-containing protein [Geopsychrobacteraceae bacterium]